MIKLPISHGTPNRITKAEDYSSTTAKQTAEQMAVHHLFLIFSLVRFFCIKAKEMNNKSNGVQ